ncbi:MAG: U32 family peptidase [Anaerovibrio sp.]|uniref:peptidase U32 family protein n=1 Tax=Anaerovibrio sp. TaxID=1872532 RepID=UPI0025FF7A9F|nr:U32 family peptidase [Anaerovibrio sp.]MCR5176362.1 U32 family peptidase [Anaerovibrio sp.]
MILNRKSVELLAPAGNWDALVAAVEAGADAVYLGGKHFNMRMHRNKDTNFDDEMLKKAIEYTHAHDVRLYITLNNLISVDEVEPLKKYLAYLNEIRPDAILVQDFAVLEITREMGIDIPLHTSVMMNTHNEHAIKKLKEYGITRIVVGREMTLSEMSLFKERTGLEIEYFMHGDMCIAESGQCIHSGVVFGQSGNRGRCLKPCRWPYKLIDEKTGELLDPDDQHDYKLALNDMCMYRNIPELIQAGVFSFKIEGRMRPADFIRRIVSTYRRAIDNYIADPFGYQVNEEDWQDLYKNRARNFTTAFALGQPDASDIGFDGSREPRFFSEAVEEAGFQDEILKSEPAIAKENPAKRLLSVQVSDIDSVEAACKNGADIVYLSGEVFKPKKPWSIKDVEKAIAIGRKTDTKIVISTPRTTMRRECGELEQYLHAINSLNPDGIMVSNLGSLKLAQEHTKLPVQADFSFNLFNHMAASFMKKNGIKMATASLELSFGQLRKLVENSPLPIEVIVHGSYESMICDHNFAGMILPYKHLVNPEFVNRHYALKDKVGGIHSLRMDQFNRNHILFTKDLCYYPYLDKFNGIGAFRIEAKDYSPELTASLTAAYRKALDNLDNGKPHFDEAVFRELQESGPRQLGIGVYRFRQSQDSL